MKTYHSDIACPTNEPTNSEVYNKYLTPKSKSFFEKLTVSASHEIPCFL